MVVEDAELDGELEHAAVVNPMATTAMSTT